MKRRMLLLLVLCLLLPGCGAQTQEEEGMRLYFLVQQSEGEDFAPGCALDTAPFSAENCTAVHREGVTCPGPGCLLTALLAGTEQSGLRTPFPKGTTLKSWNWDGDEPGRLRVVLSEQYSGLTDIALTLADYCIVLTLCQLDGVETVEIQTAGYASLYRGSQVLSARDALLDSGLEELAQGY